MLPWFQEPASALKRRRRLRRPSLILEPADPMTSSQSGVPELYQHVLVVEDDPIIALGLEDTITDLGVPDIRIAADVATALAMIAERAPQFALLDVGLVREKSFAIAERLTALGIPFAFSTGYGADRVPAAFADRPRLPKPCPTDALEAVLRRRD